MKKLFLALFTTLICLWIALPRPGNTEVPHHQGHAHDSMSHAGHMGEMIHTSEVNGHELMYHLIDMREKMKNMKMNAPQGMPTHHLMVFVKSPGSRAVKNAKVGYLISGPGNDKQKVMAMEMSGGYGADITLQENKTVTIRTKVVAGESTLTDSFTYHFQK